MIRTTLTLWLAAGIVSAADPLSIASAKRLVARRGASHGLLRGVVTARLTDPGSFYIEDESSGVLVTSAPYRLAEGERVEVQGWMYLTDASEFHVQAREVWPLGTDPPPRPRLITLEAALAGGYEGRLVSIRGTVLRVNFDKPYDSIWLEAGRASVRVFYPRTGSVSVFESIYPGMELAVDGISVPQTVDPEFDGYQIRLRAPQDLTIRRGRPQPPGHAADWISSLAGLALLGAVSWNWTLRHKQTRLARP